MWKILIGDDKMKNIIKKSLLILGMLSFSAVSFSARKVYVKREPSRIISTIKSRLAIRRARRARKSKKVYVKREPRRRRR